MRRGPAALFRPRRRIDLIAVIRTEISRRAMMLCPDPETRIEAAVDQGQVAAVRRDAWEAICEVELELKQGDAAALYDIAIEMVAVAPVRLERRSKSARGFRLAALSAEPERIAVVKAEAIALDHHLTAGGALRRIARSCAEQIVRNEAAVFAGMPDGVHQMRVGVRRLRAILSAFAPLLSTNEYRWFSDELRWLGASLGVARNLDVFADGLVAPAVDSVTSIPGIAALNAAIAERRAAAYADAAEAIGSTRYTVLVLRLMRWTEDRDGEDPVSPGLARPIADIARKILRRRLKAVRRRSAGFSKQSPEDRHRLRIALKKLRYTTEMLGQLYGSKKPDRLLQAVKQLQEELGNTNDLRVSRDFVAELAHGGADAAAITEAGVEVLDWRSRRFGRGERKIEKHVGKIRDYVPFW